MITFTQFAERLAKAELKNTSAVNQTILGVMEVAYIPTILSLTNQALTTLSTKFSLFKLQADLTLVENKREYSFETDTASLTMVDTVVAYDPERFIKILNVYNAEGEDVLVNMNGHITTSTYNRIRFTDAKLEELSPTVRVRFQARHPEITENSVIELPPNLETALQLLVASLYIGQMNGPEHSAKSDNYYAAYLRHIGEDELKNTSSVSEIETDNRFEDRGFV